MKNKNMIKRISLLLLFLLLIFSFIGPIFVPYDPFGFEGIESESPSIEHWLGTGEQGQDVFSQLIYGTRTSLFIAVIVAVISTFFSTFLGIIPGYQQKFDRYINGLANVILVMPTLLIVLIVVSFSNQSIWILIFTLGLITWPGYMRIIRSQVLSIKEREYVKVALLLHAPKMHILSRHILPQLSGTITTKFLVTAQSAVAMEVGLSFLGLGDPTRITLGTMLQNSFSNDVAFLTGQWKWTVLPPTLVLILMSICLAVLSESIHMKQKQVWGKKRRKDNKFAKKHGVVRNNTGKSLLTVRNLHVNYGNEEVLKDISISLKKGEITALLGSSGAGKTTFASSILGMIPTENISGQIYYKQDNLLELSYAEIKKIRWLNISMIFQDPRRSLNPLIKVGKQLGEVLIEHEQMTKEEALGKSIELIELVGLEPELIESYPHELSGGMCSRILIAMALANKPDLIIADEPTASLDWITRKDILDLLQDNVRRFDMSLLFITHDIEIVAEIADHVIVLKEGALIEDCPVIEWFENPKTVYSQQYIDAAYYNNPSKEEEAIY